MQVKQEILHLTEKYARCNFPKHTYRCISRQQLMLQPLAAQAKLTTTTWASVWAICMLCLAWAASTNAGVPALDSGLVAAQNTQITIQSSFKFSQDRKATGLTVSMGKTARLLSSGWNLSYIGWSDPTENMAAQIGFTSSDSGASAATATGDRTGCITQPTIFICYGVLSSGAWNIHGQALQASSLPGVDEWLSVPAVVRNSVASGAEVSPVLVAFQNSSGAFATLLSTNDLATPPLTNSISLSQAPPSLKDAADLTATVPRLALDWDGTVAIVAQPAVGLIGQGSVEVYSRQSITTSAWILSARATPPPQSMWLDFAYTVRAFDGLAAVGAPGNGTFPGRVALFLVTQTGNLTAFCSLQMPTADESSFRFGASIDLIGNTIPSSNVSSSIYQVLVGATAISASMPGLAYLFEVHIHASSAAEKCVPKGRLGLNGFSQQFGHSVALSQENIVVGDPKKEFSSQLGSILGSHYCLPHFYATTIQTGTISSRCSPCSSGHSSPGGQEAVCTSCSLPAEGARIVWAGAGQGCSYSCSQGPYLMPSCQFNCSHFNPSALSENEEWDPSNEPNCLPRCKLGFYNDTQALPPTCTACAKFPNATLLTAGSCQMACLNTTFNSTTGQAWSCETCSKHAEIQGLNKPLNSHWVDGHEHCFFRCDSGYLLSADESSCSQCSSKPQESTWSTPNTCAYDCKTGFFGNQCLTCALFKAQQGVLLPTFSQWSSGQPTCDFECNSGHFRSDGRCCPSSTPANAVKAASATNTTCGYACIAGFTWSNSSMSCDACPSSLGPGLMFTEGCQTACADGHYGDSCLTCLQLLGPEPSNGRWLNGSTHCTVNCSAGYSNYSNPANISQSVCCRNEIANAASQSHSFHGCTAECSPGYWYQSSTQQCLTCQNTLVDNAQWGTQQVTPNCQQQCISGLVNNTQQRCVTCTECMFDRTCGHSRPPPPGSALFIRDGACEFECPGSTVYNAAANLCCGPVPNSVGWQVPDNPSLPTCKPTCSVSYFLSNDGKACSECSDSDLAKNTAIPDDGLWTDGRNTCDWTCDNGKERPSKNSNSCCPALGTNQRWRSNAVTCNDWECSSDSILAGDACVSSSLLAITCSGLTECSQCALQPGCGWCSSDRQCFSSAFKTKCQSNSFREDATTCDFECSHASCSSCLSDDKCAWCGSECQLADSVQTDSCKTDENSCPTDNIRLIAIIAGTICGVIFLASMTYLIYRARFSGDELLTGGFDMPVLEPPDAARRPRLTAAEIERYPVLEWGCAECDQLPFNKQDGSNGTKPECAVCLCSFEAGDSVRVLGCMHSFHQQCVDQWLRQHADCPICRRKLLEADPPNLQLSAPHRNVRAGVRLPHLRLPKRLHPPGNETHGSSSRNRTAGGHTTSTSSAGNGSLSARSSRNSHGTAVNSGSMSARTSRGSSSTSEASINRRSRARHPSESARSRSSTSSETRGQHRPDHQHDSLPSAPPLSDLPMPSPPPPQRRSFISARGRDQGEQLSEVARSLARRSPR